MKTVRSFLQLSDFWATRNSPPLDKVVAVTLPLLILVSIVYFLYRRHPELRIDSSGYKKVSLDYRSLENARQPTCQRIQRDTHRRVAFSGTAYSVYSWPSSGGVIIKDEVDVVELTFLGLDRLNPQMRRDPDSAAEDAFGRELRKIGGKWWCSEQRSIDVKCGYRNGEEPTEEERKVQIFGWPSCGGLLVLEFESEEEIREDIGRLTLAVTMDERCRLLEERFQAKLYRNAEEYEGFAGV
ncbi:hypothetical protein MMC17_000329 [Xylographa soralifera]|nr:hypothetical protein [Xylographa soralifera]